MTTIPKAIEGSDNMELENRYQLLLNISMSARYHQLAEKWYQRLNDFGTFISLVAGSAVFAGLMRDSQLLTTAAAALVTLSSALNLVMGTARKAMNHREQYRRFCDLEARAHETSGDEQLRAEIKRIEQDDYPALPALAWLAYHQNLLRWGQDTKESDDAKRDLRWWQRIQLFLV